MKKCLDDIFSSATLIYVSTKYNCTESSFPRVILKCNGKFCEAFTLYVTCHDAEIRLCHID